MTKNRLYNLATVAMLVIPICCGLLVVLAAVLYSITPRQITQATAPPVLIPTQITYVTSRTSTPSLPTLSPTTIQPPPIAVPFVTNTPKSKDTVAPTSTMLPAALVQFTNTPLPTIGARPTVFIQPTNISTPLPRFQGTEADFKNYLRGKYNTISGTALEIEDVSILTDSIKSVSIELSRRTAVYTFSEQTKADATAYGTSLLKDTIAYFGRQECSAYVEETFYDSDPFDVYDDEEWDYIGHWSSLQKGWFVIVTYVKAHFINGKESVQVWNWKGATPVPGATLSGICCKICAAGKACGDTCISKDKTCNQPPGCACD